MRVLLQPLIVSVSTVALAACAATGPSLAPPQVPAAAQARFVEANAPDVAEREPPSDWWRLYNDPVLDQLVETALAANKDVAVALANLDVARASLRAARGDLLPQTEVTAGAQYGRASGLDRLPDQHASWLLSGGLNLSYEADLFGRVRKNIAAARADVEAAEADRAAVQVEVAAETARAYADIQSSTRQLEVARRTVALLDESVTLSRERFEAGRSSGLDVARITALRDQQRARIPDFEAQRDSAIFRLATLTGRTPRERPLTTGTGALLTLNQAIPVGDGRMLLARRPDVRAAERRLAAASARVGVATADLYPRISLGGSLAAGATSIASLFSGGALGLIAGPLLSWSFPNQQVARARVAQSEAQSRAELARFDKTVLTALQETETALSTYRNQIARREALQSAADQAERAARITRAQLREGRADGLAVLDAERTLAQAQSDVAEADARLVDDQVDLFKALGGGWQKEGGPTRG